MSDNVPITGGAGYVIATDDVGGVQYQVVKHAYGADGVATALTLTTPLPVAPGAQIVSDYTEVSINAATSGENTLVALTASQTIRVYGFFLIVNGAAGVSLKFRDGASGTDFHPALPFADKSGWIVDPNGRPWFTTTAGVALILHLSAAIQVSGRLYYTKS
jgi:hypothetical protein